MDHNDAPNAARFDEDGNDLRDVLDELHAWRDHADRKAAETDERFLRTFTDIGEIVTTVQQRTQMYSERES
jgi:UV DNA damage repair endonuclease